jgi:hypothetical protein
LVIERRKRYRKKGFPDKARHDARCHCHAKSILVHLPLLAHQNSEIARIAKCLACGKSAPTRGFRAMAQFMLYMPRKAVGLLDQ